MSILRGLTFLSLTCSALSAETISYRFLGKFDTPNPAFVNVEKLSNGEQFLTLTSFSATNSGKLYVAPKITDYIKQNSISSISPVQLATDFAWPNNANLVPPEVFGKDVTAFVVPDGFLVPFHTNGAVYIVTSTPADLTK